ncbi:MAG: haloacid dehalogenase [Anaerolineae bacterium]
MENLEIKNAVREASLGQSRRVIQHAAQAIRATHRGEYEKAEELMTKAGELVAQMASSAPDYPDIYFAGYVQDAQKEFAEAKITHAIIAGQPLPDPDELGVEYAAYLNALGEAVGELRRHVLDIIRHHRLERGEEILQAMEEIYAVLVTVDFPHAITGNLRRTADMVRGVLERTRGDLTMAMRQEELQAALENLEERLEGTLRD